VTWKVAGEFVNLKNITVGLNSPLGVRKAAFHSSLFDPNVVVSPADINFSEEGTSSKSVDDLGN